MELDKTQNKVRRKLKKDNEKFYEFPKKIFYF